MTTMQLSSLLFKNPTTLPVTCVSSVKLCGTAKAGVGISAARTDGSTCGAKLSAVALVIDAIMDKRIAAYEGKEHVFVQYKTKEGDSFNCIANTATPRAQIKYIGKAPEMNWQKFIPVFLLETREADKNEELKMLMKAIAFAGPGVEDEDVLKLCDSFYFGNVKGKMQSVDLYEEEVSLATVEAAFRSGLLTRNHNALGYFDAPMVEIDGMETISTKDETESDKDLAKTAKDVSPDKEFEAIRAGEKAIAYPWTEEQKNRIPSLKVLDDFVPTAAFWKGSRKISYRTNKILERLDMGLFGLDALGKDVINFFMTGKPGTGKTTVAQALAAAYQIPFYSIPIQKGTEEGTFQGLLKARDGKFVFTSTDFLEAFKNGGVIVLEELNLADPAILSGAIGQAVESPYFVMEDDLTPVYRHPMCIIIGTFNVGTAGSKEINPMLSSRFYQTYVVEDPNEDEFISRLMKFDCNKRMAKKIYTAYTRILDYLRSPDVSALEYCKNVTFRGCVGAIQCLQEGSPFKEAIEDTLVGKIAEYDLELAHDVRKNVVETLPD